MQIARRAQAIAPSPTLALTARAKALAAKGVDVVGFGAGEPDFDTPAHIKLAAVEALHRGHTKYTPTGGIPELKAAIASRLAIDQGLDYRPEELLVSCGAKHSLYNLFQALLDPGDEVVILAPYWVSYPDIVMLAGGVPVIVPTRPEDGYAPRPEALAKAIGPRTRALLLNSPSNPTGALLSREQLTGIAEVVRGHDCLIVSDDIYGALVYGGRTFLNIAQAAPDLKPRTVVINGCSKAYAMTGWRIGWAAGPAELIAAMQKVQDQSTSNPTSIAQHAAVAALIGPSEPIEQMVMEFDKRRRWLVEALNAIPGITCAEPGGAFYVFPDVRGLLRKRHRGQVLTGSADLAEALLVDHLVAAVPGAPFGAEGYLRLSFATSLAAIEKGVARIGEFARALEG
ncbi:MAG: pyridoxal phosphate-dependent aminotransferase [Myxococcales bacterium]|nr:pyridoxal phosphate-dependent aminotransferase [Myxococcales bacterium]